VLSFVIVISGCHNIEGAKFKFEVWTDHKNLEYFIKTQKLNRRQARCVLYLLRFDFTLKYIPEIKIGKADGLSRRLAWKVEVEKEPTKLWNNTSEYIVTTSRTTDLNFFHLGNLPSTILPASPLVSSHFL